VTDPIERIFGILDGYRRGLLSTNYLHGCPIGNLALELANVAHADIDLKIGGKMRTHYVPNGQIGDANTIENTILCFELNRRSSLARTQSY